MTEKLDKKNNDSNFIIFEVYIDKIIENKNKLSNMIRYRADEEKKFSKIMNRLITQMEL